jgi:hypothetical protein
MQAPAGAAGHPHYLPLFKEQKKPKKTSDCAAKTLQLLYLATTA